jgi:O-antigen ligase
MSARLKFVTSARERLPKLADGLAVALAISLPWSTSATSIVAALLLLALIPTIDIPALKKVILTPACGAPLILVALGAAGMFWGGIPWADHVNGISSFLKLLFIPLLLFQFSRSEHASEVLAGFLISCGLLLICSWILLAWPVIPWPGAIRTLGVPVKDYISQSAMFTICIFVIARLAFDLWRRKRHDLALALIALSLLFLANLFYVATSRTSFFVIPILLVVFGFRVFGWKGATALILGFILLTSVVWQSASYLRHRVDSLFTEVQSYRPDGKATSAGERLTFWTKSIGFIQSSPIIGHGTGSIHEQFKRSAVDRTGMAAEISANPHNQILAVGIQLGLIGIAVLLAMWQAHLALFIRSGSFAAWVGLVVVIQNVVGSLFNSHLFDFTHGWVYVVGVGVAGGVALKELASERQTGQSAAGPDRL